MFLLLLAGTPAAADYKNDYVKAQRAVEDGEPAEAIALLREAISENPTADERVRWYGQRIISYVPYFYLGKALAAMGDCDAALDAFQQSLDGGVIQELDEFSELNSSVAQCRAQTIDVSGLVANATEALDDLLSTNERYGALENDPFLATEWSDSWAEGLQQSAASYASLRNRLRTAEDERDASAIELVIAAAEEATQKMTGNRDLALARSQTLAAEAARRVERRREAASQQLREALAAARSAVPATAPDASLEQLLSSLTTDIARAEQALANADEVQMQTGTQALASRTRQYQEAEQRWRVAQQDIAQRTPPDALKRVAETYFSGDYAMVVELKGSTSLEDRRARLQLHLFGAAAHYKLYMLSGERRTEHLRQAQESIRTIKSLDAGFAPYISAFSPRFLEFFRTTS
ncbi:MAG: hypothetical protein AAGH19_06570 [Pseudomonadota bacterium]